MGLPEKPRVLCISRDSHLMRTRQLVLATQYEVVSVDSIEGIEALPTDQDFDLIVLCHSLSSEECDQCVEIASTRWPQAKIVALSVERADCSEYADRVVRGMDGPRFLLQTIDRLLLPQNQG
jgi:hypothetical protein